MLLRAEGFEKIGLKRKAAYLQDDPRTTLGGQIPVTYQTNLPGGSRNVTLKLILKFPCLLVSFGCNSSSLKVKEKDYRIQNSVITGGLQFYSQSTDLETKHRHPFH